MSVSQPTDQTELLKDAGVVTTLIDAGMELANGRPKSAALLAGAAAVSTRVPGFGTAISLLLRGYRRIR